MLDLNNLVGNQEDWANFITNVETQDTPFLDWVPVLKDPIETAKKEYQAEKWATPALNSKVDGEPWKNFQPVGEGRGELQSVIQWVSKTGAISKLSEDVTKIAGIAKQMARDVPKKMHEMRMDIETNVQDDHESREDNKVVGYLTRPVGKWVDSAAQTHLPVPEDFRTPAASISSTASGSLTEDTIADVLASMLGQTKKKETITGFVGLSLKRKFSRFQFYLPSSTSTQASGVTFNQQGANGAIVRAVDRYESDAGTLELHLNFWLAAISGSATAQAWRGHFLHKSMWQFGWKQKPKVYNPEFKGGAYEFAMDAIFMLLCLNPKGEGKYAPTA